MIARKQFDRLDDIFFRSLYQTTALALLGAATVWTAVVVMNHYHIAFAHRILPPLPFALMLLSMVVGQIINSWALYLRAHKQEKFLFNSVLGAICLTLSTYFLGRRFGALGMTIGQLGIAVFIGLTTGYYTFSKWRRLWHV